MINLQLFNEDDAPEGMFQWYDPQTKKNILIPEKVGDLDMKVILGHVSSGIRKSTQSEIQNKYEKQLRELQELVQNSNTSKAELEAKVQQFEDEKLTQTERMQKEIERTQAKYKSETQKAIQEAQEWQTRFNNTLIDNEILGNLPPNVYNPEQTKLIIKNLLKPEIVKEDNNFKTMLQIEQDGEVKKLTPKEAIEYFLAQKGNEHHLKNNLTPGANSSNSAKSNGKGGLIYTRESLQDPKVRAEYRQKAEAGQPVQVQ